MLKTVLFLLPFQLVFRVGEAVLPLLLAAWFGRSESTDVYYFALALFQFAAALLFSAYHDSALVPIVAELRVRDPSGLPAVLGALLAYTLAAFGAIALVLGACAFVYFGAHYPWEQAALARFMIGPFLVYLLALALKTFFGAVLNAHHKYTILPIGSGLGMAVLIGTVAWGRAAWGVRAIPVGVALGELVALTVVAYVSVVLVGRPRLSFERPPPVREFASLTLASVGGGAVVRVNPVVDQLMAGFAGVVGGGTLLRYSSDVATVPTSLLQAALLPVLLSHVADFATKGDRDNVRRTLRRAMASAFGVLAVASLLLFLIRVPLLRLVYMRGEMDLESVAAMAEIFPYHLVGLAPFGVLLVLARVHTALKNNRIMVSMGILNAGLNAILNVAFLQVLGLAGIALATSLVNAVVAIVFYARLPSWARASTPSPSS